MATVNFGVPEDVKHQFDKVFAGKNKSEVLTQLMQQAIKEQKRLGRRRRVINCLLALREQAPRVTDKGTRLAKDSGPPMRIWVVDASVAGKWALPGKDGETHQGGQALIPFCMTFRKVIAKYFNPRIS
jgi:hypothetical protein